MATGSQTRQVSQWLTRFEAALNAGDTAGAVSLFDRECFWRDLLAFTWNVVTLEGREAMSAMLDAQLAGSLPIALALDEEPTVTDEITEAWFKLETRVGRGRGHLRLKNGRCWTLLTTIDELKGHEERRGTSLSLIHI